jgi:predicted nucleic acid-binding protein
LGRKQGITIRKTIDVIIATFCIEQRHALLFADKDFLPFVEHLGLVAVMGEQ